MTASSYAGPERRRQGLLECLVCERRLRPRSFRSVDPVSGRPGLCEDCESVRDAQIASELRSQFVASPRYVVTKDIIRDENENITQIIESEWGRRAT
jgi:hypothetical protein